MYDVSDVFPDGTVSELDPGTSILIAGPAMIGKQALALDCLAAGLDDEDGLLIVTTNESAATCLASLESRVPSLNRDRVGIVDCSGSDEQQAIQEIATQRVSSPGDLTGISIGAAKLMEELTRQQVAGVRHGLVSVSTLLQYIELETVFKFLHIYTNRIDSTDGLGVFTVDNVSHDEQTVNTILSEFDVVVELRENDAGEREAHVRGLPAGTSPWEPF